MMKKKSFNRYGNIFEAVLIFGYTIWFISIAVFLLTGLCFLCGNRAEAAANSDGSVTINEENFPDELFREGVKYCDENRDGVLSKQERSKIIQISIDMGQRVTGEGLRTTYLFCEDLKGEKTGFKKIDMIVPAERLCIDGICYFENITDVSIKGLDKVSGSMKQNKKLLNIEIEGNGAGESSYMDVSEIQNRFYMKQVRSLSIRGVSFDKFELPEAVNLSRLYISGTIDGGVDEMTGSDIKQMNLSYQKKLKTIELHDVTMGRLDLRKNTKLTKVSVTSGVLKQDYDIKYKARPGMNAEVKKAGISYYDYCGDTCSLLLPSKNKIESITYFTADSKLDLTECKKLKTLHVREGIRIKLLRQWYKKTGRNKLRISVSGEKQKSFKIPRKGKYMYAVGKKSETSKRGSTVA